MRNTTGPQRQWTMMLLGMSAALLLAAPGAQGAITHITQALTGSVSSTHGVWGGPIVLADLDGNGHKEIVVVTMDEDADADDYLYAFHYSGGALSPMAGWPVPAPYNATTWMQAFDYDGNGDDEVITMYSYYGYIDVRQADGTYWRMPKVGGLPADNRVFSCLSCWADVDHDGQLDCVSVHRGTASHVTVRSLTGAQKASWVYGAGTDISEGVAVGDLDLDGDLEVAVMDDKVGMNVFHHDGTPFAMFPNGSKTDLLTTQGNNHMAIVNVDSDPEPEILYCCQAGALYVVDRDGTTKFTVSEARVGFSCLDLNKDGIYEILYGQKLYDGNGTVLRQLPTAPVAGTFAALADFNGDGVPEAVYFSGPMEISVYDLVAQAMLPGWPQAITGSEKVGIQTHWWASTPVVADLDGDGTLEVVAVTGTDDPGSTVDPVLNVWSVSSPKPNWPISQASRNAWPMFYHDPMNTSAFALDPFPKGVTILLR